MGRGLSLRALPALVRELGGPQPCVSLDREDSFGVISFSIVDSMVVPILAWEIYAQRGLRDDCRARQPLDSLKPLGPAIGGCLAGLAGKSTVSPVHLSQPDQSERLG